MDTTQAPAMPERPAVATSPSPPPQPTTTQQEIGTDAPAPTNTDPKVAELRAMFPDFDDMLLSSVLDSVHGNQDRAVDALLGMSDPEYKSEAPPAPAERPMTQEELDEQLARRLLMEDEQLQHHQWQQQQQHGGGNWGPQPPAPAFNRRPSQQGQGQEKDTMTEISEQFTKIAESGKRTFGNIFNKVKAKMAEMDQPRNTASSSSQQPPWGVGGDTYPYDNDNDSHPRPQQASYYNPNPSPPPVAITNRPLSSSPVQGYDLSSSVTEEPAGIARPPSTGQGQPIDSSKLGLLPKRPVSLLRTSPPPVEQPTPQTKKPVDDDELEYVENPFEDGRK